MTKEFKIPKTRILVKTLNNGEKLYYPQYYAGIFCGWEHLLDGWDGPYKSELRARLHIDRYIEDYKAEELSKKANIVRKTEVITYP